MPIDLEPVLTKKIVFWNRLYRTALLVMAVSTAICTFVGVQKIIIISNKLDRTTSAIKETQDITQRGTIQARKDNFARQDSIKDYIKCLSLVKFDVPADQLTSREGVQKALDDCASK